MMNTTGIVSPYYRSTLCKCVAVTVKDVNVLLSNLYCTSLCYKTQYGNYE